MVGPRPRRLRLRHRLLRRQRHGHRRREHLGCVADGKEGGKQTDGQSVHFRNFLDCIKTRNTPNADVEIGHLSTRLCHLGNIAHRVGRKLTFDAATESFGGDAEANALLSREYSSRFEMPSHV